MMKRMLIVLAAMALITTSAMAASLVDIPFYDTQTNSSGRAITPDGLWVAGNSGGVGILYDVAGDATSYVLSSDGAGATQATGIGYRLNPDTSADQLVIHGMAAGWDTTFFTSGVSSTFLKKNRLTNVGSGPTQGACNTLGSTSGSDVWYASWADKTSVLYLNKGSGGGDPPSQVYDTKGVTAKSYNYGASASGRSVGKRLVSVYQNYLLTTAGGGGTLGNNYYTALDGTNAGEGWALDASGTVVGGMSPVSGGRTGNWGYVATDPATGSQMTYELPTLNGNVQTGYATNSLIYGLSADGKWAAGMDYTLGTEKAVLWDLRDLNNIKEKDLTDLAIGLGILGDFTLNLRRAYSVGVNGDGVPVITGQGYYTDATLHGFVMTIPEPATLSFLALGGLALLRRRR